jgi:glycosyltransferase involved in cell wall biosynthesis
MGTSVRQPPCIGIYEPSRGPSGPSRYVESILKRIDPDEFQVAVLGHATGPYHPGPGRRVVPVEEGAAPTAAEPAAAPAPAAPESSARLLLSAWRRLAPDHLRELGGFGLRCLRLARKFRQLPLSLLHTNNTGCEESPVAARLAGVPHVLGTFHVDSTYDLHNERSGPRHRVLEYVSNQCLHRAIAVSHATKQDWVRRTHLAAERVLTIHNGIDPEQFVRRTDRTEARRLLGLPADRLLLGGVGRLDEAKGFGYLIEAVALLASDYPDLLLVLAGQGPLRQTLEARVAQLGVADQVRFLGFRKDVQPVYDALDVFTLSSLCEALPYALLEAMATELPVVGTAVAGVPEVIVPGETGFVVPPRDPQALAAALRPLLESADLRRRLGSAGRARVVRHFHERDMVRRTLDVYRNLLRIRPHGER